MTQSSSSSPRLPISSQLVELLARLRIEQGASTPQAHPLLAHELGVTGRRAEDPAGAMRELLAAYNADPRFREPLEALLHLLESRPSSKNLGKLIEVLVRAAETPAERARALCKRGAFLLEADDAGARLAFEAALAEDPADPTAWLELEIVAAKQGDAETRARALEARSKLTKDPSWRGLLLIARAELESRLGHSDAAIELLKAASGSDGLARYPAWEALEALALREKRHSMLAEALEARGELAKGALTDGARGDALGVPRNVRNAEAIAELLLRAADARRWSGDTNGAIRCLDRALALFADDPTLSWARLAAAEASGDQQTKAKLARTLLESGATGATAASLWVRVAEEAAQASDSSSALQAVQNALELDSQCIPANVLELELIGDSGDPSALAQALERHGDGFITDRAKARAYWLAATAHALGSRDLSRAKAALTQAANHGAPPSDLARTARLFATVTGDRSLYDEAISSLASAEAKSSEATSLWFELARIRLLGRDVAGGNQALAALGASPLGAWLGDMLLAYGSASPEEAGADPLLALDRRIREESDPEVARALSVLAAARADSLGDIESAKSRLRCLFEANPKDELAAIYLADLERRSGQLRESSRVLSHTAGALEDPELASALRVEAFVLAFRSGDYPAAIHELQAAKLSSRAIDGVLAWALCSADPDSPSARARALDHAAMAGEDPAAIALEHFALAAFEKGGDTARTREWLEQLESQGSDALRNTAALARLISDETESDAFQGALATIESRSTSGAALAASEGLRLARARGDWGAAEKAARAFAQADGTLASAIEWLGAAFASDERDSERDARRMIAKLLRADDRSSIEASTAAAAFAHAPSEPMHLFASSGVASSLMNLELAPVGCDPRLRAHALSLPTEALGRDIQLDALLLAGFNQLAAGDASSALVTFQQVTDARPDELWGWEGVRASAEALEDPRSFAIACAHLGELCQEDARGAELWEQAGLVLLDRLNEPRQAELALEQAFVRDPTRSLAFDRLFRRVREAGQHDKLLSLIARRLEVADDSAELAKLFWEQARALRQKGNREEAIAALESVTAIEPDHVGALALSGEIFITQGKYAEAAQALARLATLPEAPDKQRLMSGIAAVDLYENKLGDSLRALEVLVGLHESGLSNLPVRERLARAAAKTGSYRHAASIFEELMNDRPTREGRIEAARLAMALWRDKLGLPAKSERAARKLLAEAPGDLEAIDVVLGSPFDEVAKAALLKGARDALVRSFATQPTSFDAIARLAEIAAALDDAPLRQASLGALVATGRAAPFVDAELADFDRRVATTPKIVLDDAALAKIADPDDNGPIAKLFEAIAEHVAEALGPSLSALGVGKKERIDPRAGFPVRNEIAAWAGALGLGEISVYIGGPDPEGVQGIAGEIPAVVVGTSVRAPLGPRHRQAVARELFGLRRGIGITRARDEVTIAAVVVAACQIAEIPIEAPPYAILGDVRRQLAKSLSRKAKKLLPGLCREIVESGQDPKQWARAAQLSMYRMAAIATGDVSLVLADALDQPRRQLGLALARDERAQRLIAFVLSPDYLELRERLGMGIK